MKVYTIEIADALEKELKTFLKDWGGGYPMRFTRFIDLGGKQTDLYAYTAEKGGSPWMIARIKSVMKTEQGECIQVFVSVAGKATGYDEVLVSPEAWKLPALTDRILGFVKNDMLAKLGEAGGSLESGTGAMEAGAEKRLESSDAEEDDEFEDLDTSGILANDGGGDASDFDPSDFISQANAEEEGEDPSDLIRRANEEQDDASESDKE